MEENESSVTIYCDTSGKKLEINYGGRNPHCLPVDTEILLMIQKEIAKELCSMYQAEELK